MIDKIASIVTNPSLIQFAQNTKACITTESLFKATGRPAFIMMDKHVNNETRKYAAIKEGLYQLLCLGIYLTLISIIFKKYGFKLAQKIMKKEKILPDFKNVEEYEAYYKLANMKKEKRAASPLLHKLSNKLKENDNDTFTIKQKLLTEENPKLYEHGKGAIEFTSLAGSVIGLALIASQISNLAIHPIMKSIGLERTKEK